MMTGPKCARVTAEALARVVGDVRSMADGQVVPLAARAVYVKRLSRHTIVPSIPCGLVAHHTAGRALVMEGGHELGVWLAERMAASRDPERARALFFGALSAFMRDVVLTCCMKTGSVLPDLKVENLTVLPCSTLTATWADIEFRVIDFDGTGDPAAMSECDGTYSLPEIEETLKTAQSSLATWTAGLQARTLFSGAFAVLQLAIFDVRTRTALESALRTERQARGEAAIAEVIDAVGDPSLLFWGHTMRAARAIAMDAMAGEAVATHPYVLNYPDLSFAAAVAKGAESGRRWRSCGDAWVRPDGVFEGRPCFYLEFAAVSVRAELAPPTTGATVVKLQAPLADPDLAARWARIAGVVLAAPHKPLPTDALP